MGRKRWTTEEQHTWLEKRIPEFLQSQRDKTVGKVMKNTHTEWEKLWPTVLSEEELECSKPGAPGGHSKQALAAKVKFTEEVRAKS